MNKIFFKAFLAVAVLLGLASCNIDKNPVSSLEQAPFQSVKEAKLFRDGLYALLRSTEAPGNQVACDYQTAIYNLAASDGNNLEPYYTWYEISLANHDPIVAYYASYYRLIMQTNYLEMRVNEATKNKATLIKEKKFVEDDFQAMQDYLAEAKVMRALAYYRLMTRFSYRYEDGSDRGLILLDSYKLDTKNKQVSQKEIYNYALRILDEAIAVLPDSYEGPRQNDIPTEMPKDFAYAVKARILLEMHDYKKVISTVNDFIGNYPLTDISALSEAEKVAALKKIYVSEDSKEIMCKLYSSAHIGASKGPLHGGLVYNGNVFHIPTVVPSKYVLDLYAAEGNDAIEDVRTKVYLANDTHGLWGAPITYVGKFEGNPALNSKKDLPDFLVSTHLFNAAEAYLMLAEAYAFDNQTTQALEEINKLRAARGVATKIAASAVGTPQEAQELVKRERLRELIGEGRHFTDLKRWGDAMDRVKHGQPQSTAIVPKLKMDKKDMVVPYDKNDQYGKMFAWEFPKNDLMTNPNLKSNWSKK